jgi:hypothetical protein
MARTQHCPQIYVAHNYRRASGYDDNDDDNINLRPGGASESGHP